MSEKNNTKINHKTEKEFDLCELADINFGSLEGENDEKLSLETFFPTLSIRSVLKKRYNYILSPKGVGKSALFSAIKHNYFTETFFSKDKFSVIPVNKAFGNDDENLNPENFTEDDNRKNYAISWGLYIISQLLKDIISNHSEKENFPAFRKKIAKIEGIKDQFHLFNTLEIINQLNIGLVFNVSGKNIELKPKFDIPQKIEKLLLNDVLEYIDEFYRVNNLSALVMVDRIDSFVSKEKQKVQKNYVQGLIDCTEEIQLFKNIRCLIFLRTDLFNSFDIKFEYDKLKERKIELKWEESETLNFIVYRLASNDYIFKNYWGYFHKFLNDENGVKSSDEKSIYVILKNWYRNQLNSRKNKKHKKKDIPFKVSHKFLSIFFHNTLTEFNNVNFIDWILEDFKDSNGFVNPRVLIYFFNQLFEKQSKYYRNNTKQSESSKVKLIENTPSYFQIFNEEVIISTFNHVRIEEVRNINKLLRSTEDKVLFQAISHKSSENGSFKIGNIRYKELGIERDVLDSLVKYLQLLGYCKMTVNDKQKFNVPLFYQMKLE
jgi:hypothetical protein